MLEIQYCCVQIFLPFFQVKKRRSPEKGQFSHSSSPLKLTSSPVDSNLPQDSMCFNIKIAEHSNLYLCNIYIYDTRRLLLPGSPGKRGLKRENFNHATTMVVVLRTVAAQHRAHHAKPAPPAGFYILCVELIAAYQSNSCIHCSHT